MVIIHPSPITTTIAFYHHLDYHHPHLSPGAVYTKIADREPSAPAPCPCCPGPPSPPSPSSSRCDAPPAAVAADGCCPGAASPNCIAAMLSARPPCGCGETAVITLQAGTGTSLVWVHTAPVGWKAHRVLRDVRQRSCNLRAGVDGPRGSSPPPCTPVLNVSPRLRRTRPVSSCTCNKWRHATQIALKSYVLRHY